MARYAFKCQPDGIDFAGRSVATDQASRCQRQPGGGNFEKFKQLYEKNAKDKACPALQAHPNAWDDRRWDGFVKIVEFLKDRGCMFVTPSEYLAGR